MSEVLETLPKIAEYMGRHPQSIQRWIKIHGFPACRAPNGKWITTTTLIDSWILARNNQDKEKPGAGKSIAKKDSARGKE